MRHSWTFVQHLFSYRGNFAWIGKATLVRKCCAKDAFGIFWENGLIFTLFVLKGYRTFTRTFCPNGPLLFGLAAGDRLGVDLGVPS